MKRRKFNSIVVTAVWCIGCFLGIPVSAEVTAPQDSTVAVERSASVTIGDYSNYIAKHGSANTVVPTISLTVDDCTTADEEIVDKDDRNGVMLSPEKGYTSWRLTVPVDGLYQMDLLYYALEGKGKSVILSLKVDGVYLFEEMRRIELFRTYRDSGLPERDAKDNDIRPTQVEVFRWNKAILRNRDGYYHAPYSLYLTAGEHTLSLASVQESCLVGEITLKARETLKSYTDYAAGATEAAAWQQTWEAEQAYEKSSSMLYPTYDRSTSATLPSHHSRIRLNTIGQTNWQFQGQWISWKLTVPEDGWYQIGFKARQNYQQGTRSFRTLYIDGEIPFAEAELLGFDYDLHWYRFVPSDDDGDPYLFWLTAGEEHTLTLECAGGPMAEILKGMSDAVLELNTIYRNIIMVTGITPDVYRTFYLEDEIPTLREDLTAAWKRLETLHTQLLKLTGGSSSQAATVKQMSYMIETFLEDPLDIPSRIASFKDNIESMGSILLALGQQPLELDAITVSAGIPMPAVKAGFWKDLQFQAKSFLASFVEDYSAVGGGEGENALTVWISHGRDQAQILKKLIDDVFTPQYGIQTSMSIVNVASGLSQSTLVQATLAGKGPDVALFTPKDTPINLAMRGALCDLSAMEGFSEMEDRFFDSAWIPYRYNGGVYAVPETQIYDMLFYRTDIFAELGLTVPQTWDAFYSCIAHLQKSNLQVGVLETNNLNAGISSGIGYFDKLLLQNGGKYYTDDLKKTAFDTQVAYDAFTEWTELYTEYGLDRSFDFYNRFRTGEMPLGIMSYTLYNQLYAAAPEIRGLWSFAPVPGTMTENGLDRSESATGTAAIILSGAEDTQAAFRFVDWWTSAEVQSDYGNELEAILGIAARYDTANVQAFEDLAWSDEESALLKEQWDSVTDIPQIPGNYFVSRCLTNAFRTVVDEDANPVRILGSYNKDMNSEIARKRKEFHLDD